LEDAESYDATLLLDLHYRSPGGGGITFLINKAIALRRAADNCRKKLQREKNIRAKA